MSHDPQLPPTRPFTSIAQAAYRIGVPEKWLKKEADEGRVPSLLVGKHRRVNTEQVLEVLMERANSPQDLNLVLKQRQHQGCINLGEPPIIRGGGTACPPMKITLG